MKIAQNRYERRKIIAEGREREKAVELESLHHQYEEIKNGKDRDDFNPDNKYSIEEIERRKLIKNSKCFKKTLAR